MMVGRELSRHYFPDAQGAARTATWCSTCAGRRGAGRAGADQLHGCRRGEILGFAGLVGAGRTELMQTIFGVTPALGGAMTLERRAVRAGEPARRDRRAACTSRRRIASATAWSCRCRSPRTRRCPNVRRLRALGLARPRDRAPGRRDARSHACASRRRRSQQQVVNLSGGNQQKVVLGKWLAMNPRVLILDEPTRGIDVGAKAEIYRHMAELADAGIAILMVSSDMEEVIGMSDRVVVMHERRISGIVTARAS